MLGRRLLLELHGGAGAMFGVMLFVLLFSGSWAMGHDALQRWAMDATSAQTEFLPVGQLLDAAREHGLNPDGMVMQLPKAGRPWAAFCKTPGGCGLLIDARTGEQFRSIPSLELLKDMHKSLFMGFPGRVLVSLFGITLVLIGTAGFLLHGRRWRQLFRWRRDRGLRVSLWDLHGLIGIWILPWLMLFALTGLMSGLGALGTVLLAPAAYPDAPRQVFSELVPSHIPQAAGQEIARAVDINALLRQNARRFPRFTAQQLTFNHWHDQAASLTISGIRQGLPSTAVFERHLYRRADGALLASHSATDHGTWTRAFVANQPLHFGQYEWLGKRWANGLLRLHLIMGLAACALAASGLYLWIERRPRNARLHTRALQRAAIGICGGLVMAACAMLLAVQTLPVALQHGHEPTALFWSIWAASVLAALFSSRPGWLLSRFFILSGLACLVAAVVHFSRLPAAGASVDLTLLAGGLLLFRPSWWLTRPRPAHSSRHRLPKDTEHVRHTPSTPSDPS